MNQPEALFLFAHQDDEFGTFAQIEREMRAGARAVCLYATDGSATADPAIRNAESLRVLDHLGVTAHEVLFVGTEMGIGDGRLVQHMLALADWLNSYLCAHPQVVRVYLPAWEGGHPDHDALHATALQVLMTHFPALQRNQYSLYNARGCVGPLFQVLTPIPENGVAERTRIGVSDRLRYLRYCLRYRSQWRSWVGLWPMVLRYYLLVGAQQLQPVQRSRVGERPHDGVLYYERRGFLTWHAMQSAVAQLTKWNGPTHGY